MTFLGRLARSSTLAGTVAVGAASAYVGGLAALAAVAERRGGGAPKARSSSTGANSFAVVIAAHDEEGTIGTTLESLRAVDYCGQKMRVHVVADHCTDATAEVARIQGAVVHERTCGPPGKGPALTWWLDALHAHADGDADLPDAIAIIDADTLVAPEFLGEVDAHLAAGAEVVQGLYRARDPDESWWVGLRYAALCVRHHQRPLARESIGASAGLFGNGMVFRRELLAQFPLTGHLAEDIELHVGLVASGHRVVFAPGAVVAGEMPSGPSDTLVQHRRWERGRRAVVRHGVPRLWRAARAARGRARLRQLELIADQLLPPTSVLLLGSLATTAASRLAWRTRPGSSVVAGAGVASVTAQLAAVVASLRLAGAPRAVYRSLAAVPVFAVWKTGRWLRLLVEKSDVEWTRTPRRESSDDAPADRRTCEILGVSLDRVDMSGAVASISRFVEAGRESGRMHRVATVNVDYLVNLDRRPEIRRILDQTDLALVDGMPVLWASHWHGAPVPARVTGADLVPRLAAEAARRGHRLYLMGAGPGIADRAAAVLRRSAPGLQVRASACPELSSMDDMDEAVLADMTAWRPDIVLVALGHPKQELWIDRFGPAIGAPVFIGVGASLDFVSGALPRAPGVLQHLGLEWAYRLARDPRRLAARYLHDARRLPCLFRGSPQ